MNTFQHKLRTGTVAAMMSGLLFSGHAQADPGYRQLGRGHDYSNAPLLSQRPDRDRYRDDYRRDYRSDRHEYRRDYRPPVRVYTPRVYYSPRIVQPIYYRPAYGRHDHDGSRLVLTATGVFFGALLASELIQYMNDVDRLRTREAWERAQTSPVGSSITWNNPASSNYGSLIPVRDGYSDSGKYCREFRQTITIGGRTEEAYGTACRQPDGSWQIVQPLE